MFWNTICRLILLICVVMATSSAANDSWSSKLGLSKGIDEDLARDFYMRREDIGRWVRSLEDFSRADPLTCTECNVAVTFVLTCIRTADILDSCKTVLTDACVLANISTPEVCRGILDRYYPHVKYIVTKRLYITSNDFCSSIIQDGSCGKPNPALTNWEISIDGNKPPSTSYPLPPCNDTFRFLQINDIHLDRLYLNGSAPSCAEPVCCRKKDPNSNASAGPWGENKCDTPRFALESLLEDAALRYNYSCVLILGDIVSHFIWLTTQESNTLDLEEFNNILRKYFGNKCVIFVFGNHEPHPANMFPPKYVWGDQGGKFSPEWMYDRAATLFGGKLPPDAVASLRSGGFYTVKIDGNIRFIVLNSNFCYTLNFWLYFHTVDPDGQLQWLANTLAEAEKANEWVIILGHYPPGDPMCWSHWALQYNRITDRYANTIKGQFFGHTHHDELKVAFHQTETGQEPYPTGCRLIGPSAGAFTRVNPGYKVFEFENCTGDLLDFITFYYDIDTANNDGKPTWKQLCSARGTYGFNRITPEECYAFVLRMLKDPGLFQLWYSNRSRRSRYAASCVDESPCPMNTLCGLVTTVPGYMRPCNRLKEMESQDAAN